MRTARVSVQGTFAGLLIEHGDGRYSFRYLEEYHGPPVSLTLPVSSEAYFFDAFPPFFEGLLPEGGQLEGLLRRNKIDRRNYFLQLLAVGGDLVGDVTVTEHLGE